MAITKKIKKRGRYKKKEQIVGMLFAAPIILKYLIFMIGPMLMSLYYSFTDYRVIGETHWVGLKNYQDLLTNADTFTYNSFKVTVIYVILYVIFTNVLAYILASAMVKKIEIPNTVSNDILYSVCFSGNCVVFHLCMAVKPGYGRGKLGHQISGRNGAEVLDQYITGTAYPGGYEYVVERHDHDDLSCRSAGNTGRAL